MFKKIFSWFKLRPPKETQKVQQEPEESLNQVLNRVLELNRVHKDIRASQEMQKNFKMMISVNQELVKLLSDRESYIKWLMECISDLGGSVEGKHCISKGGLTKIDKKFDS